MGQVSNLSGRQDRLETCPTRNTIPAARDVTLAAHTIGRAVRLLTPRPRRGPPVRGAARRGAVLAIGAAAVVFAAVQALLSGASAVTRLVADPVYADKERRLRWLERAAPPGTARVVLLGTSRTGFAFDARRTQRAAACAGTPAVAFNFGVPGAGPIAHRIYVPRLLADGHKPDLLVLEILPPLLADLPGGPFEARFVTGDALTRDELEVAARYGVPAGRLRRQWAEAALLPVTEHRFKLIGRLYPEALPWNLRCECGRATDANGWNPTAMTEVSDAERARGVAATTTEYRHVVKCELPAGPAVDALRDTLALCRAEGVPVALVILPESTAFRGLYPPGAEAKLAAFLAGLTAEFGCPVTDARAWMPDDAFMDGHHLLRPHGEAFTDRLTAELILPFLRARAGRNSP